MGYNKREWSYDEVANLIQLYEEHEFLWNDVVQESREKNEYV